MVTEAQPARRRRPPLAAVLAALSAVGGLAEVQLGELAQRQGASNQVKQFGAQMVKDHGQANQELKSIAAAKGLDLPTLTLHLQ